MIAFVLGSVFGGAVSAVAMRRYHLTRPFPYGYTTKDRAKFSSTSKAFIDLIREQDER